MTKQEMIDLITRVITSETENKDGLVPATDIFAACHAQMDKREAVSFNQWLVLEGLEAVASDVQTEATDNGDSCPFADAFGPAPDGKGVVCGYMATA